ncbi:hypothetical protein EV426DRAFT_700708 [Tirmania nivea]|nr:hypothetical protein EV426DRAFT_700708 [Tirmania nivea]
MQAAATRRSIHSAFIQLQLQSRCRRPLLLLGQLASTRENGAGVVGGGFAGRVGRRWWSGSGALRDGKAAAGGGENGRRPEDGAVEGVEGRGEESSVKGVNSSSLAESTTTAAEASPPSSSSPSPSSNPGTTATSEPLTAEPLTAATSDTPPAQTTKSRGRPLGSSNTTKRRPPPVPKPRERDSLPTPDIPAWFLRDGVMVVEDNLARPTNLSLWITPERSSRSREEIKEALEACGAKLIGEGEEEYPLEAVEQLAKEVSAEGRGGGVVDSGAVAAAASPQPPPGSDSDPKEPATVSESAEAKEEPNDAVKDNDFSITVGVNKFVQIDHTLQEAFPGISPGQHLFSAVARLGPHAESHLEKASNGKNRYAIHVYIWREIMAHVTAGLALPKASSNDSDVATKSHVLLKCPREGGLYFLDSVVEHAASLARADVVRIDPQDLEEMAGDYLGDAKYFSLSNITSQKIRTLGYDAQSQSHSLVPAREEDLEEDEEEDDEYINNPPEPQSQSFFAAVPAGQGISPLRAAMVALIPGGANPGNTLFPTTSSASSKAMDSDRRNEKKLYKLLEAIIDSATTKRAQNNVPAVYQDPWYADPMAPHDITHVPPQASPPPSPTTISTSADPAPLLPTPPLPTPTPTPQKTIIHIRDYSELLRTPQGAPIIRMIHTIVSQRRLSGHPILILGTTSTPETSYSLTRANLEAAQELTLDANERAIIVPPAKSPAEDDLDEIMESDRRARIREVNIRHLRDIIRRRSGEGRGGIELMLPKDWHLREDEVGEGWGIEGIEEEMWSFDRAHRVATMAIGMYHKWWQSVRMPQVPVPKPVPVSVSVSVGTTQLPMTPQQQKEVGGLVTAALGPEGITPTFTTPPRPSPLGYTPGILTPAHISAAVTSLNHSDNLKYAWALTERRRLRINETTSTDSPTPLSDDLDDIDPSLPSKPKSTSSQLMKKLSKNCNSHEQKLLSGVINPDKIHVGFSQVRAPKETVEALKTLTSLSLIRPEAFRYGVLATDRIPGVLLYGPPGTGKTLLARAVAKESGATVLEVSGSDIFDMYVGEGEKNVRAIFTLASRLSPCIIFLDEADAILASRSSASSPRTTHREIINQFLREWADVPLTPGTSTFLMVATNRPFDLDDAVLRRLPRRILVDLPTQTDRLEILKIHLRDEAIAADVQLPDLARRTQLYSGSDLKNLCVAAALACVKEAQEECVTRGVKFPEKRVLQKRHFEKALKEVGASVGEDMGSLGAMRKWDEKFGEGRKRKGARVMGFGGVGGKDGAGGLAEEGMGRVRKG